MSGARWTLKLDVDATSVHPSIWRAIEMAAELWIERSDHLVVTSLRDGDRSANPTSFHPRGLAVDFRTRHLSRAEELWRAEELLRRLGPGYDVRLKRPPLPRHMHVEHDGQQHAAVAWDGPVA